MNAQNAHTPGPWRYEPAAGHAYNCIRGSESAHIRGNLDIPGTNSWSDQICENLGGDTPTIRANIALICEAGTVATETGLTPRQLADQRAELLEALRQIVTRYVELVNSGDCGSWNPENELEVMDARAAIAKATGEQP